jgi:hypothetical protein
VVFAQHIADKTNWQRLLKSDAQSQDLALMRDELMTLCAKELAAYRLSFRSKCKLLTKIWLILSFPVQHYPLKVKSFNFDTTPQVKGVLQGIKGQYLMLDTGVLNLRKFGGYEIMFGEENV